MTALISSSQITELSDIITPENLGAKRRIHTVLLIVLFAVEAMIFHVHVARDIAPYNCYDERYEAVLDYDCAALAASINNRTTAGGSF